MQKIKFTLALLLLGLILVFVVQNLRSVEIRFLTSKWNLPVAIPVVFTYVVGAISGRWVFRFLNARREERKHMSATKKAIKEDRATARG